MGIWGAVLTVLLLGGLFIAYLAWRVWTEVKHRYPLPWQYAVLVFTVMELPVGIFALLYTGESRVIEKFLAAVGLILTALVSYVGIRIYHEFCRKEQEKKEEEERRKRYGE